MWEAGSHASLPAMSTRRRVPGLGRICQMRQAGAAFTVRSGACQLFVAGEWGFGMPADAVMRSTCPVTHSGLAAGLRALGVRTGCVLMVQTGMSAVGWVVGASETVVRALLEALGPDGTLLACAGWSDNTCRMDEWPSRWRDACRSERPPFDPLRSEADPQMGRVPERIRTGPGAVASGSHYRRMVAVGRKAEWLTGGQPWDHASGPGSPLAKLVQAADPAARRPAAPSDHHSPRRITRGRAGEAPG